MRRAAAPIPVRATELPAALVAPAKLCAVAVIARLPSTTVRAALFAALVAVASLSGRAHALPAASIPLARAVAGPCTAVAARLGRAGVTHALAAAAVPLTRVVAALHAAASARHLHPGRADALAKARVELTPAAVLTAGAGLLAAVPTAPGLGRTGLADTTDACARALLARGARDLGAKSRTRARGVAPLHAAAGPATHLARSTLGDTLQVALAILALRTRGAG